MSVYAITYDLNHPGQDYSDLHDAIKSLGNYSKRFDSFWLVDTIHSASEIRERLKPKLDSNDTLLVIEVKKHWAGYNMADGMIKWLKNSSRSFN